MADLLVSVRSVQEAESALAGGAGLIDVKEPARGALGRADAETIAAIVHFVAGRRPVSAALGEYLETPAPFIGTGLSYAKWGLAGCGPKPGWRTLAAKTTAQLAQTAPGCRPVAVAYADWRQARSPQSAEVVHFACGQRWGAILLDTWSKDGRTLLDWLLLDEIISYCKICRRAGVRVALAGSLRAEQIERLRFAEPNWFAVRAAACRDGRREQEVCSEQVRRLSDLLKSSQAPEASASIHAS